MPAESSVQNVTSSTEPPAPPLRTRNMPQPQSQSQQLTTTTTTTGSEKPRRWIKRYRTEVSASSASVLSTISAFPLDSVKTRLQTYPYNGFIHCVKETYKSEGLRGFFRGRFQYQSSTSIVLKNGKPLSVSNRRFFFFQALPRLWRA